VVLPGLANVHSHAFHRALRGRTHAPGDGGDTFWTWRERMYALAGRLDPDSYRDLATAVFAEMALTGITGVGEFHYLHHGPGGVPYRDPNAMAESLRAAAVAAGLRLTLLDTCYLTGGIGTPLTGVQRRFGDVDAAGWARRFADLAAREDRSAGFRVGAAVHSVRAVPAGQIVEVVAAARDGDPARPLHVHLSEQVAENTDCLRAYGTTPTRLLVDHGVLGPHATAVHATHLTACEVEVLGGSGAAVCLCPTTERDLADGIGPAGALHDAGARLVVGTDQHAVIDLVEEARAVEMHERLVSGIRGRFDPGQLVGMITGHAALGWDDAGRIEVGARADLVSIRLDSVRTAGCRPDQALLAASAADVDVVVVDGRTVVESGRHLLVDDAAARLARAISPLE
jgi:formiminoglutamate deiminase